MTDQPTPEPTPSEPTGGGDSGMLSEEELTAALAEASSLAADLSEEVGACTDRQPAPAEEDTSPRESLPSQATLDAELGELERLVDSASDELAEQEEPSTTPDLAADEAAYPPPAEEPEPPADPPIPDFMAEFTRPEGLPAAAAHKPAAPEQDANLSETKQVQPSAGISAHTAPFSKTATDADVAVKKATTATEAPTVPEEVASEDPATRRSFVRIDPHKLLSALRRQAGPVGARISPIALRICDRAATILETIDRPLGLVGEPIRRVLGWVAIATVGTVLIVFLYTFT